LANKTTLSVRGIEDNRAEVVADSRTKEVYVGE
jgi:hypothetical protein